jgi:NADPH:quinone reductase-like Zn-dependent oxidoreductase
VTVVDRGEKLDALNNMGADHVIDYTKQDFTRTGKTYDLILDNVAWKSISDYQRALKPGGAFVMVGGSLMLMFRILILGKWLSKHKDRTVGILAHKPNVEDLDHLTSLIEDGKLKPVVDSVFPLEQTKDAFDHYANDPFIGKVVIAS